MINHFTTNNIAGSHIINIKPNLFLCLILFAIVACDHNLDNALNSAGKNRKELEKVLKHFKDNADPLKYQSAKFLIENMPYHYTYTSKDVETYNKAYLTMSDHDIQSRNDIFKKLTENMTFAKSRVATDLLTIKAPYLIKAIDDACDMWHNVNWSNEYDESIFFDYVLPYRLLNEPLSNWRSFLNKEYSYLKSSEVYSKRGQIIEAETAICSSNIPISTESASQGKLFMLNRKGVSLTFSIHSTSKLQKRISLRYTTTTKKARVLITLNGQTLDTIRLEPTSSFKIFRDSRTGLDVTLSKGNNTLSISFAGDTIGIDYIQTGAVEPYNANDLKDFSTSLCCISNQKSGHYLTFDTLKSALLSNITLKPYSSNDSCQLLRLNYLGYPCWNICAFKTDSIDLCMEAKYCLTEAGDTISQYKFQNGNHQKWVFMPLGNELYKIMSKDNGLFLEAQKDKKTGKEIIVQNPYSGKDSQKWRIGKKCSNPHADLVFKIGSSISEALRIFDITNQYEWIAYDNWIAPKATSLCLGRTGNCRDETDYVVYLCRYLGIPSAIDFTPHWGNRSQSHSWSVLIKPDGKSVPFYMGCAPGDTAQYYHCYRKPKVFRHRFRLNREIATDLRDETEIPPLFINADFIDVTDEYYAAVDIEREIPQKYENNKVVYVCVFDNREWVPVFYGNIRNHKVTFKSMGRGIVYMAALYYGGKIVPFGEPFILNEDGSVKTIKVTTKKRQAMILLRKYPFMGREDFFNARMSGGRFQGSDSPDFSGSTEFHVHKGLTNGNWYEIPVNDKGLYSYLRYIGPNGSYCNINELAFYDEKGKQVFGKIIGTEGEPGATKENVFDGDILTGFNAVSPDGHWVGLSLSSPTQITKLRYIPRNDGNGIEVGDKYELYFWNNNKWNSLGKKTAKNNSLVYKNMPAYGIYVLSDLTKGSEERLFTYKNNEQVWW